MLFRSEAGFTLETPLKDLTKKQTDFLWNGDAQKNIKWVYKKQSGEGTSSYNRPWLGIFGDLRRRYNEAWGENARESLEKFMSHKECASCHGKRLRPESLGVTVGGKNIWDLTEFSVTETIDFFEKLELSETEKKISAQILKEIKSRLSFLKNVGLEYLTLQRSAATLSGGEAQRIRLSTQIGSGLTGVMYILDEPSIGLHQRDNQRLIDSLLYLRNLGNTVIVVEHDEQTLLTADYLVDIGPGAGVHGGKIMAAGTPQEVMKIPESLTGQYLAGKIRMEIPKQRRTGNGNFIKIQNVTEHNLKNVSVEIPLGTFTCITGVSGSGKSTLLNDVLFPAISNKIMKSELPVGAYKKISGLENIDKVISIDQSPIGRTPRSNPVTYIGVFDKIRELYASIPEAKAKGYKSGRFSFNVKGGRCEACAGDGILKIEMHFLPDVYVPCEVCGGKRYNRETLEVKYKGKSIYDVLNMTVEEAVEFFANVPSIRRKMETLNDVGLSYIRLGQPSTELSGGEAQRIKLAAELSKRSTGKTVYILDEPTTGLHFADVHKLTEILARLAADGNTVIVIEHNLDVIKTADYIIDIGPEGGDRGGTVVACGTPEEIAENSKSYTGKYIRAILDKELK